MRATHLRTFLLFVLETFRHLYLAYMFKISTASNKLKVPPFWSLSCMLW